MKTGLMGFEGRKVYLREEEESGEEEGGGVVELTPQIWKNVENQLIGKRSGENPE